MIAIKECSDVRNCQAQYLSLSCVQYKINRAVAYFFFLCAWNFPIRNFSDTLFPLHLQLSIRVLNNDSPSQILEV